LPSAATSQFIVESCVLNIERLILLVVLCMQVSVAWAAPRLALIADAYSASQQVQMQLVQDLGLGRGGMLAESKQAGETLAAPPDIVIAVGLQSLRQAVHQTAARQIISVLLTRAALEDETIQSGLRGERELFAIVLDQPTTRYLDLLRIALPQRTRVGVLLGPTTAGMQKVLERQAAERGLQLEAERLGLEDNLVVSLERLLVQVNVMLALPDAVVHNRNTVQPLLLTTYRVGIPVLAYSEAYSQAGALLALYSTPAQLARQTAELGRELMVGRNPQKISPPRYFTVGVNAAVARSLGLKLPDAATLNARLVSSSSVVSGEEEKRFLNK
jgi:putative ABC transport system substrate-binding protein